MTEPYHSATIQPPIIAYTVARVYRVTGDEEFLAGVAAHPDALLPLPAGGAGPGQRRADRCVIQPEEAGTDCSPKYDEILGLGGPLEPGVHHRAEEGVRGLRASAAR